MIRSLGNELPDDEIWEADLYANKYKYKSTPKYD